VKRNDLYSKTSPIYIHHMKHWLQIWSGHS